LAAALLPVWIKGEKDMPSRCPKCHEVIENDIVCCAEVKYTWKCASCGKLSTGFVIPYGRCFLCGGKIEVVDTHQAKNPVEVSIVQEAVRYELDMFHFYRLAMSRTSNSELREVLEDMSHKEEDHLDELEEKYHVHLDPALRQPAHDTDSIFAEWIFRGIDLQDAGDHVLQVYDKAIEMERRTHKHFMMLADSLPPGVEKETYRELAAEEEEHVALLEMEREQFAAANNA
jgi:glutamate synthase (NADPH) small chain